MIDKGDIVTYTDKITKEQQQVIIIDFDNNKKTAEVRSVTSIDPKDNFFCLQSDLSLEIMK